MPTCLPVAYYVSQSAFSCCNRNTRDWVIHKEKKFMSHGSGGWEVQEHCSGVAEGKRAHLKGKVIGAGLAPAGCCFGVIRERNRQAGSCHLNMCSRGRGRVVCGEHS